MLLMWFLFSLFWRLEKKLLAAGLVVLAGKIIIMEFLGPVE